MRPRHFLLLIPAAVWLTAAPPASGSQVADGHGGWPDSAVVPGRVVRLRLADTRFVEGTLVAISPDTLVVRWVGTDHRVPRSAVTDIWTREPAFRGGARRGAIAGGLLFALAGASLSVGLCDAAECPVDAGATAVGLALGTLMGAITGGVVGTFGDEWVRRYP